MGTWRGPNRSVSSKGEVLKEPPRRASW